MNWQLREVRYSTVLYGTVLVQYSSRLVATVPVLYRSLKSDLVYSCSTSTVQYSTVQYSSGLISHTYSYSKDLGPFRPNQFNNPF